MIYHFKMRKEHLDIILEKHKAQPVGSGYIDIIVRRENYQNLIHDLIENGFEIESISWWEWCENETECKYGLGSPKSDFYDGWFAEIPTDVDDLQLSKLNDEESIKEVVKIIEDKSIKFSDETIKFKNSDWLTPALWLNVPDECKNRKSA